jgi:hypothetical protein
MPVVPLARYEDRYSRAIGKWILNAANASRLFYSNAHGPGNQSSEFWAGDPQSAIAYEGLRHNWLPPHLLKPGESQEIYAGGDPLTYDWGPLTDFGIYGSAFTGVLGSIIRTTNVEKVLQLDLLATDFYRGVAHPTYLYYNPHPSDVSVAIDLGQGSGYDLYDAVSNRFLARDASGNTFFNVPKDNAVQLVLVPAGSAATRLGRQLVADGVVIDYNATLPAGNLLRNPDLDSPPVGGSSPSFWHRGNSAVWATDAAVSPTHSLKLADNSTTRQDEWRSYATAIPDGTSREVELSLFWKLDIEPGSEFRLRLRYSADEATGTSLTNPAQEWNLPIAGETSGFELFTRTLSVPDGMKSFDLSFISGGSNAALGTMYVDDISAALAESLVGDFDGDGAVDGNDFLVWQRNLGATVDPGAGADANRDGRIDANDLEAWKAGFGSESTFANSDPAVSSAPEPAGCTLVLLAILVAWPSARKQLR